MPEKALHDYHPFQPFLDQLEFELLFCFDSSDLSNVSGQNVSMVYYEMVDDWCHKEDCFC